MRWPPRRARRTRRRIFYAAAVFCSARRSSSVNNGPGSREKIALGVADPVQRHSAHQEFIEYLINEFS
jgi:hypothetical protein